MAKKTRKAVKTNKPKTVRPAANVQAAPTTAPAAPPRVKPASATSTRTMSMAQAAVTFREEYRYVFSDLKRTAILAAAMFAVMIILAFVLR